MSFGSLHAYGTDGFLQGHYAYLLFCEEGDSVYVKVGMSQSPLARLTALTQGLPFTPKKFAFCRVSSRQIAKTMEQALLDAFQRWRSRGEWLKMAKADAKDFSALLWGVTHGFDSKSLKLSWNQISVPEYRKQQAEKRRFALRHKMRQERRLGRAGRDFRQHLKESA